MLRSGLARTSGTSRSDAPLEPTDELWAVDVKIAIIVGRSVSSPWILKSRCTHLPSQRDTTPTVHPTTRCRRRLTATV